MGSSQVNLGRSDLGCREIASFNLNSKISSSVKISRVCIGQSIKWPLKSLNGFSLKASACSQVEPVISENDSTNRKSKPVSELFLFFSFSFFHLILVYYYYYFICMVKKRLVNLSFSENMLIVLFCCKIWGFVAIITRTTKKN